MDHFVGIRAIGNLDGNLLALAEPDQRTGDLPVVRDGLDDGARRQFERIGSDADGIVGPRRAIGLGVCRHHRGAASGKLQKLAPVRQNSMLAVRPKHARLT